MERTKSELHDLHDALVDLTKTSFKKTSKNKGELVKRIKNFLRRDANKDVVIYPYGSTELCICAQIYTAFPLGFTI